MAADISGMGTQSNPDARLLATCLGISRWLEDTTDVRPGAETRLRCQIDGGLANALLGSYGADGRSDHGLRTV